jgi:hypothetical protein
LSGFLIIPEVGAGYARFEGLQAFAVLRRVKDSSGRGRCAASVLRSDAVGLRGTCLVGIAHSDAGSILPFEKLPPLE